MTHWILRTAIVVAASLVAAAAASADPAAAGRGGYTFGWRFSDDEAMRPRGGTTTGPAIQLASAPSADFEALGDPALKGREKDQQAIRALAGAYRTSFDFLETMGFSDDYTPSRPYQSWGTEYVYVVADEPGFVSLQHILVMKIVMDDGEVSDPFVIKHWRHDWTFEDRDLHEYAGFNSWAHRRLSRADARGSWTQAVFQVDDSPRYETVGRWTHRDGYSHWESERFKRPLPRREFSVRDDYHALDGTVRITLTPTGWVMEEDALKLVLDSDGTPRASRPFLAREAGISRYEHIVDYDFSAGDRYWESTGPYWAAVRDYWNARMDSREPIALTKVYDNVPLYQAMFSQADAFAQGEVVASELAEQVTDAIAPYWTSAARNP